ncbi:MAG: histidine phosphatase family protein [Bacteroidota bacterium]|nr:histidine phosphatase family protein [Bacteroidota bacterium]
MKKIIFVRHGRAEEQSDSIPDFERSLTTKGKVISEQMAVLLKGKTEDPGLLITSPAFRAYETALVFARVFKKDPDTVLLRNNLYNRASLNYFAEMLAEMPDEVNSIILFGHNPAFTEIADRLSKDGCDFLPKSAVACLSFRTDTWKGVMHEKGRIEYFLKPDKSL